MNDTKPTLSAVAQPSPAGQPQGPAPWVIALLLSAMLGNLGCQSLSESSSDKEDFYPIGIYGVSSTNELTVVAEAGFNVVRGPADESFLDAAAAHGLKVLASPNTSARDFNPRAAQKAVSQWDSHPGLWAWYLIDEPEMHRVAPQKVREAHQFLKAIGSQTPTALVLYQAYQSLHYANISDILMVDRYPVPWLPVANLGQHLRMARLSLGPDKPLIAVIQCFDWTDFSDALREETTPLRPPTYQELREMVYDSLAQRATGLFFFSFHSSKWDIREHPGTWAALQLVIDEVHRYKPLFQAEHLWWPYHHDFANWDNRFNEALASAISPALLRVKRGNDAVPRGDYLLAVNTTDQSHEYQITPPDRTQGPIPVLGEDRNVALNNGWITDEFSPYAVHIYGPLPGRTF